MPVRLRTIPFGYCIADGKLMLHEAEALAVRRVFENYADGHSYSEITLALQCEEIQYRPGVAWNKHMVKRILEDRRYLGDGKYPAIMTMTDFEAVNSRKAGNPSCRPKPREKQTNTLVFWSLSYAYAAKTLRLTNEINRALERNPDVETIRPLIFTCAAEKYKSLAYVPEVSAHE